MNKRKLILIILLILCLFGCSKGKKAQVINVEMAVKDYGTVKMELYPDVAPKTVENFVDLTKEGFYDGKVFHRIIDGFMIQGGADFEGKVGKIEGEFASNGFENNLKHTEGVISMARANDPNSASSQFFIMVGDGPWLDGEYAAFGKVTEGLDVVKKIAKDARPYDDNGSIYPEEMPVIEYIKIVE